MCRMGSPDRLSAASATTEAGENSMNSEMSLPATAAGTTRCAHKIKEARGGARKRSTERAGREGLGAEEAHRCARGQSTSPFSMRGSRSLLMCWMMERCLAPSTRAMRSARWEGAPGVAKGAGQGRRLVQNTR